MQPENTTTPKPSIIMMTFYYMAIQALVFEVTRFIVLTSNSDKQPEYPDIEAMLCGFLNFGLFCQGLHRTYYEKDFYDFHAPKHKIAASSFAGFSMLLWFYMFSSSQQSWDQSAIEYLFKNDSDRKFLEAGGITVISGVGLVVAPLLFGLLFRLSQCCGSTQEQEEGSTLRRNLLANNPESSAGTGKSSSTNTSSHPRVQRQGGTRDLEGGNLDTTATVSGEKIEILVEQPDGSGSTEAAAAAAPSAQPQTALDLMMSESGPKKRPPTPDLPSKTTMMATVLQTAEAAETNAAAPEGDA